MKILHVTHTFYPCLSFGGVVNAAYQIGSKQVKKGHEVHIYTTDTCKERLDLNDNYNVNVNGMKVDYFKNMSNKLKNLTLIDTPISAIFKIRKDIKNYDIIHIHEHRQSLAIITCYFARKYKIPYVVQAHGSVLPFFQKEKLKEIYDKLWGFKTLRSASKVFALTETEKEQYLSMGVDENNIEIIPLGINLDEYNDKNLKKGVFRHEFNISDKDIVLLFVGRIHEIKGLDLLINSFNEINKDNDNVKLVIVGPDDGFEDKLKKQVLNYGLTDKVIFTGPLYNDDKFNALNDCDIFIMPSKYESFTTSGLEAMACGKPLILTKNNHIHDWVGNNVGLVCDYDINELKICINKLINDKSLRMKFGNEGKELIKNKYNWDKICDKIIKTYKTIIIK